MDVDLAVIADAANVSQEGKLNILGVFDTIWARVFPFRHASMVFVLRVRADFTEQGAHRLEVRLSGADYSVAVSGIAGPGGGTEDKPVGTVWIAWAERARKETSIDAEKHIIKGDREAVRARTVIIAMQGIRERIQTNG